VSAIVLTTVCLSGISLGGGNETGRTVKVTYGCPQIGTLKVTHRDFMFADLEFNCKFVKTKTVISGSSARYFGGGYTWWSKGNEGTLFKGMNLETMKDVHTCLEELYSESSNFLKIQCFGFS
jgi:membrane-bound inhibitor of C-type lysozyme